MDKYMENLKAIRKAAGLTQRDFAKKVKISQSMIALYENGARCPSYPVTHRYLKLAENLGLSFKFEDLRPD